MILVTLDHASPDSAVPAQAVVCHDVRDQKQRSEVLIRKGRLLGATEIIDLLRRPVHELHLAVPEPGDLPEDEAVEHLGSAIAGPGVRVEPAQFGQVTLTCDTRGMLRLNAERLERVNEQEGVLLLTAEAERPVDTHTPVGVVKCAPLFLSERVLQVVEAIRSDLGPVIQVEGFRSYRTAFVAPRERLRGNAFERATASLSTALEWYGSSLAVVVPAGTAIESLAAGFGHALAEGAEFILAAGATGTDPADVVFEALRRAGGMVDQIGIPAEPGTACWIGQLEGRPVLGLASCELFGQPGALDLLLPRVLCGEPLDRALLRGIANGGLLVGGPSRIAPYHMGRDGAG
jgi:molybdenum cofactor cytidylyltransferase